MTKYVHEVKPSTCDLGIASLYLFETTTEEWLANEDLTEEVFSPLARIESARGIMEVFAVAKSLVGQLTCTIHMDNCYPNSARTLLPRIKRATFLPVVIHPCAATSIAIHT